MNTSIPGPLAFAAFAVALAAFSARGAASTDAPQPAFDPAAVLRELQDTSAAGMNRRLGPDYKFYHPNDDGASFPEIYLVPEKPAPPHPGHPEERHYQWGGPWTQAAGDFSSTQGQVLYVPDRPLKIDPQTHGPNEGIGVDRVTIIGMSNGCFTEKPEPPWWGGFRPEPSAAGWLKSAGKKLGQPLAVARGAGGWANSGLVLFSSGVIATGGTATGRSTYPTFNLPANKLPLAISITNKNEFALVTVTDTDTMHGQVAVFALGSDGTKAGMPHEWTEEHAGFANVAVFTRIKLLGYVDLPGVTFPTGISAVGNRTEARMNGRDGNAGMLREYSLHVQADRDVFDHGSNAGFTSTAGYAVVIAKYENKAVFIDLQALFAAMRKAYVTTEENFQATLLVGDAPGEWPYTFAHTPEWTPTVVKTVDIPRPTAVLSRLEGGSAARAIVASEDGTLTFFKLGGLATEAPALAGEILPVHQLKVGPNPTCLTYQKYGSGFLAVSRGAREIAWIGDWGDTATVVRRLRDRRLIDPVGAEVADTHGIQAPIVSIVDFAGRQILNYRYGVLIFATQGGARFGVGPDGKDEIECGGFLKFPGRPFAISATNVN